MAPAYSKLIERAQAHLTSTDIGDVTSGLSLVDEAEALALSGANADKKVADAAYVLRSELLSQLALLRVRAGDTVGGFSLFLAVLSSDLARPIWNTNLDQGARDRHLGKCVDACAGFVEWVDALERGAARAVPAEAAALAPTLIGAPAMPQSEMDKLWLLIAGRRNYATLNEYSEDGFRPGRAARLAVLRFHGADMEARYDGSTALRFVAILGDTPSIKYLLKHGARVDDPGKNRETALMATAARKRSAATLKLLMDNGADPNATASNGRTPLFAAAYGGSAEGVKALIDGGADANFSNAGGLVPLAMAARSSNIGTLRALLDNGAVPTVAALKEAEDNLYFEASSMIREAMGDAGKGEGAHSSLAALAKRIGKDAATSADDSGDFYEYTREDGNADEAARLIAEQYWEAQYLDIAKSAIKFANVDESARGTDNDDETLTMMEKLFHDVVVRSLVSSSSEDDSGESDD